MAIKNTKKPVAKTGSKSKKSIKTSNKSNLSRLNVNIPRSLYKKAKQFVLKHNITIREMIGAAIKEYMNKLNVEVNKSA